MHHSWLSPLVWTLSNCERLVHFQKKIRTFCNKLSVLVFCHKQAATRLHEDFNELFLFLFLFSFFFVNWGNIRFFHSIGNFSLSMHDLKISSKGFKIQSHQMFKMQILIMPKSWALFWFRFLMILAMPSLVNEIVAGRLFVLLKESLGGLLVFSTSVHCLTKKLLKIRAFSVKSVI